MGHKEYIMYKTGNKKKDELLALLDTMKVITKDIKVKLRELCSQETLSTMQLDLEISALCGVIETCEKVQ